MNKTIDRSERKEWAELIDQAIRVLLPVHRIGMPELAERARIKLPTLYAKLAGEGPLELPEVHRIAAAFGLTEGQLITVGQHAKAGTLDLASTTWRNASLLSGDDEDISVAA